jgi:hypothetical protein
MIRPPGMSSTAPWGAPARRWLSKFERNRLRRAGRDDLAEDVRWVSDRDGDHLRYDIRSFDGQDRLLEVKTTNGHARTRFWLSNNQCDVAAKNPETYVRRVYHFRNGAEMFDIRPPLNAGRVDTGQVRGRAEIEAALSLFCFPADH